MHDREVPMAAALTAGLLATLIHYAQAKRQGLNAIYNIYLFGGVRVLAKELCCGLKAPEAVVSNRLPPRLPGR